MSEVFGVGWYLHSFKKWYVDIEFLDYLNELSELLIHSRLLDSSGEWKECGIDIFLGCCFAQPFLSGGCLLGVYLFIRLGGHFLLFLFYGVRMWWIPSGLTTSRGHRF
jgi:hypothetical protein